MKKTRLLEIIREEITDALNEIPAVAEDSDLEIKKPSKYKHLAEKYQIDEEIINEMASIRDTKKVLDQIGDEESLEILKDAEKETLKIFKKDYNITSDGRLQRDLPPEERKGKRDKESYIKRLETVYKEKSGGETIQDLFDRTEMEAKKQGIKYNMSVSANTINKNAANAILGKVPNKPGPKADPNKPKKEKTTGSGKRGRPTGSAKTATRTTGDDGFDDVSYSDDEETAAATKSAGSDETAKELGATPEDKKEKFNMGLKFIKKYKDDKPKIDAYMKKAKEEYKLTQSMLNDLNRAAGRGVE